MDKKQKALSCKLQATSKTKMAFFLVASFTTFFAKAQDTVAKKEAVDMATGMRSSGKIYVVVAVLCIILAGVFIYLANLDKKISKLEKDTNAK